MEFLDPGLAGVGTLFYGIDLEGIKAEQKLVMSDKFTLSDNMTDHFLRYIITLSSSPSHFNIRNTHLSQISSTGNIIFSYVLLSYALLGTWKIFCKVRSHFHGQFLAILNFNSNFPK